MSDSEVLWSDSLLLFCFCLFSSCFAFSTSPRFYYNLVAWAKSCIEIRSRIIRIVLWNFEYIERDFTCLAKVLRSKKDRDIGLVRESRVSTNAMVVGRKQENGPKSTPVKSKKVCSKRPRDRFKCWDALPSQPHHYIIPTIQRITANSNQRLCLSIFKSRYTSGVRIAK
jgi:hypothetical protein